MKTDAEILAEAKNLKKKQRAAAQQLNTALTAEQRTKNAKKAWRTKRLNKIVE